MRAQPECPECEKMSDVSKESNAIGDFLDWLENEKWFVLARWSTRDTLYAAQPDKNKLLAEYYDIDLEKVEQERRDLLNWIRESNNE
jgi:hypothetical protein